MKILEVVHGFPPAAQGGAEIYAEAHARALEAGGDDVLILTREQVPARREYDVRTEARDGLRIIWINNTFRGTRRFEDTYRNDTIGAIARDAIDDFAPDAAHIHHLTCLSTSIVRILAERRIPSFYTLHDYWLLCHRGQFLDVNYAVCDGPGVADPAGCHNCLGAAGGAGAAGFVAARAVRAVERGMPGEAARRLRQAAGRLGGFAFSASEEDEQARRRFEHMREVCGDVTHFLAPSRHMRDRFVRFGVAPERITVAGYGFDRAPFERHRSVRHPRGLADVSLASDAARRPARPLRLGFLGSLMVSKAPHLLLEAASQFAPGDVTVDLFGSHTAYHGDESYRDRLAPMLGRGGVTLHGPIAHERVAEVLSSIDALVVPSVWPENSPLVIQEAFLAGVPVVAARLGGIPEVVEDGRGGLLFEPGDAGDLARVLARLIQEPGLLESLTAAIPPVRSIEEDVRAARELYAAHVGRRPPGTRRSPRAARSMDPEIRSLHSPADPQRVAAVVLNYGTPDETLLAVKSLLASRSPIADLIVVNNGAVDGADEALRAIWSKITYVETGRNLGFSGGVNAGIRVALARGAGRVLLVNSDVIVPPDTVEHLDAALMGSPSAGIVGPVVLARSDPDRIASLGMSYRPSTGRMRHRGNNERTGERFQPADAVVDAVSGCLMLVRREVFDAIGLFEEDYFFTFEDLDFCLRARRAGFATLVAGKAAAYHEGGRSLGAASPRRFYFAARNHLLLAHRAGHQAGRAAALFRSSSIVLLNLAHAVLSRGGSLPERLGAVSRGTRDYFAGRYGPGA